ncbi:hypothetical protein [Actinopolymorpha pittospori]
MRRLIAPMVCLFLLGAAGCGSSDSPDDTAANDAATVESGAQQGSDGAAGNDAGTDAGNDAVDGGTGGVAANNDVPPCPFTAAQVTDLVGQPMTDEGNCLFGDGKGVASVTITMASGLAGATTYAYSHDMAGKSFDTVTDLDYGTDSYLAVKDIQAEAVVVSDKGSYTLIMSSFERFDNAGYEQTMRKMLDQIMA